MTWKMKTAFKLTMSMITALAVAIMIVKAMAMDIG